VGVVIVPHLPRLQEAVLLKSRPTWPSIGGLAALGVVVIGACAFTWWIANYNNRAPTAIDGVWSVTSQTNAAGAMPRWRQVFFERNRAHMVVFRAEGGSDERHHFEIDPEGVVRVWQTWLTKGTLLMQGRRQSDTQIELEIAGGGHVVLQRIRPAL